MVHTDDPDANPTATALAGDRPVVAIGAMGGTIAMQSATADGPVTPVLDADDLVAAVPGLGDIAVPKVGNICNVPSASITVTEVLAALDLARQSVAAGAVGVVLTHGTDTLEETAYLLDLLWEEDAPIVVTGAMRPASAPGADGPMNLLAAVATATSTTARGLGVLTCLSDTVHTASRVTKTSSRGMETFDSPGAGPVGHVVEGVFHRLWTPAGARPVPLPAPTSGPITVALLEMALGDDGHLITLATRAGHRGVVVAGSGVGHVSALAADAISSAIAEGATVVVASRTASGGTATRSYGYPGSEVDLINRGAIMAGDLSPRKARLLLHVLLCSGHTREQILERFSSRR